MRLSSMSLYDYVTLVGHYTKIQDGPSVDPRLLERFKNQPERLEQIQNQVKSKGSKQSKALNLVFKAPLEQFIYPQFGYVYTLYKKYSQSGVLPFPGSLADQPAQIIEIFNTLEGLEAERNEKLHKEALAEQKRNSRVNGKR